MNRRLVELPGSEIGSRLTDRSVIVLPVGAVEHHGPHLPLATDLIMAEAVATASVDAAATSGTDAWLIPGLAYTKSDEHAWAAGTMWVEAETLLATLVDVGRSVAATPARKLLFLNGHGGNVGLLTVALRELRRRFGLQTFLGGLRMPGGDGVSGPDEHGLGIHAGHAETSVMLHVRPDLVRLHLAMRSIPERMRQATTIGFHSRAVTLGWLSDDFGTDGTIGDPTGATAAHGKQLFDESVAVFAAAIAEIAEFQPIDPVGPADSAADVESEHA